MISVLVLATIGIFALAYLSYGRFLSRQMNLNDDNRTPAHELSDGIDYVPARAPLLLGPHFSAIAAAGPIVGPILAAIWFGWLPALLWIVLGAIFIGGVHDFAALTASVRHKAASVGEIARQYLPGRTYIFFLIFIWLALVYVIVAFTDITGQTFRAVAQGQAYGPGVAASSILYLGLAVVMGLLPAVQPAQAVAADGGLSAAGPAGGGDRSPAAGAGAGLLRRRLRQAMGRLSAGVLLRRLDHSDVAAAATPRPSPPAGPC